MAKSIILKQPIISEKSLTGASYGEYTFEVSLKASKAEIAKAVKEIFGVDAIGVKTLIVKGRTKRALKTRKTIKITPWKKAIIKIKSGQKIDLFETASQSEEKK
jgi:large subunit ribosomal protein L23